VAASDILKCPHCGASVSGNTDRCPNCDRRLEVDITPVNDSPHVEALTPDISDENVLTILDANSQDPADTEPGSRTKNADSAIVGDADQDVVTLPPSVDMSDINLNHPIDPALLETRDPGDDVLPEALQTGIIDTPTPLGAFAVGPPRRDPDDDEDEPASTQSHDSASSEDNKGHEKAGSHPEVEAEIDPDVSESEVVAAANDKANPDNGNDANGEQVVFLDPSSDQSFTDQSTTPPTSYPDMGERAPTAGLPDTEASTLAPIPPPEPTPLPPLQERTAQSVSYGKPIEIPSAPFTPPPAPTSPQVASSSVQVLPYSYQYAQTMPPGWGNTGPSDYWLQQRIKAYELAGYGIENQTGYDALMSMGKKLPFVWWIVAGMSVVGVLWYFLILLTSGFRKEKVYIGLEPDGYVFEEGAASAHVRRRRSRSGRRWGLTGIVIAILATFLLFMLIIAASVIASNYEAELNAAYPELTFFKDPGDTDVSQSDIQDIRMIVAVMIVMFTIAVLGVLGGSMLAVISYIQAAAYRVDVAPLPGYD
jgi:hypothetical protein